MHVMKRVLGIFVVGAVSFALFHFFVKYESRELYSLENKNTSFSLIRGEKTTDVARHLKEAHVISNEAAFLYYLFSSGQWGKFIAGQYAFSEKVSFETIATKLTSGDVIPRSIKVTFPEGFTAKQIAARLSENRLPGAAFLTLVQSPTQQVLDNNSLLQDIPKASTLEGFLFPDTYEFLLDASAEDIVSIFLNNFERRFDETLRTETRRQQKTVFEVVTMASVIETEVRSERDRKLVSDLFYRRLSVGMPLQSDATVRYALGIDKAQYSGSDIATDSPYNTYVYKGLPKGPIDNPGMIALKAALFPTANEFWYFLSDQTTGETIFARDFDEHKRNKALHGL